jgi:hypothetical protein
MIRWMGGASEAGQEFAQPGSDSQQLSPPKMMGFAKGLIHPHAR